MRIDDIAQFYNILQVWLILNYTGYSYLGRGAWRGGHSQVTFEALSQSTTEPWICANDLSHLRAVLEILRYA